MKVSKSKNSLYLQLVLLRKHEYKKGNGFFLLEFHTSKQNYCPALVNSMTLYSILNKSYIITLSFSFWFIGIFRTNVPQR